MKSQSFNLIWLVLVFLARLTPAQAAKPTVTERDVTSQFELSSRLQVTLWAESPQLFNPTAMDVDHKGRIWVTEAVNYRDFRNHRPEDPEIKWHDRGDRVLILEDTDGDGVCDSSKVFVQDKELVSPLGIAVVGDRVIVSCSPSAIIYTDSDGDDRPDKKEVFLTGFGGFDHDHSLHSFVGGADGRWYLNAGNAGPHIVTDKAGWTLRAGSSYTGGTPYNTNNIPGLKSDDGRVWVGGVALRIDADGTGLRPIGHNFRNAYELTVDSFGNVWQNDNDDTISCRTTWLMEGGNLGFSSADGTRTWRADQRPWQSIPTAHWRQDDPGVIPSGDITGPGAPTGIAFYENGALGDEFEGMLLSCEAGRNVVFGYHPQPDGAGYRLKRFNFMTSLLEAAEDQNYKWSDLPEDKRKWFRPSDVVVGADGAVYVADWYDPIVGGHQLKDRTGYGRIYRVAREGSPKRGPRVDLDTLDGQIAALDNPAQHVRFLAQAGLRRRGAGAFDSLAKFFHGRNKRLRARALWLLGGLGERGRKVVGEALRDDDPDIRITAFRVARQLDQDVLKRCRQLAADPSPAVRREVALALRDVPVIECAEIVQELASRYEGGDRWYLEALGTACDGKEAEIYPMLLARLGDPDPVKWSAPFTGVAWRLHPAETIPAFAARARETNLPLAARRKAVDALAFINDPEAARAMADLAVHGPEDIRPNALWWARNRAGNDWAAYPAVEAFIPGRKSPEDRKEQARLSRLEKEMLNAKLPLPKREERLADLAGDKSGGLRLIDLAARGKFPRELFDKAAELVPRNPDLGVRALASRHFPRPSVTGKPFPPMSELLKMRGDAKKGREIFLSPTAACSVCHVHSGEGKDIGPDLTQIRTKFDRAGVLDAILNPSASLALGYEAWLISLKDGETVSGFIAADGANVLIKQISGEMRSIPAKQIAGRSQQTLSIMPDNITLGLTPQDLVDLVKFLMSEPAKKP